MVDDDHEFPPGHFEACLAALQRDPDAVWNIPERRPGSPHLHRPSELLATGASAPPEDPQDSKAIADGSVIYPATIFEQGIWFNENFMMGPVYLEFGERLSHYEYRIREVENTFVHHNNEDRSIPDKKIWFSARIYSMLCKALIYSDNTKERAKIAFYILVRASRSFGIFLSVLPKVLREVIKTYENLD
jgi:hypothetical protein